MAFSFFQSTIPIAGSGRKNPILDQLNQALSGFKGFFTSPGIPLNVKQPAGIPISTKQPAGIPISIRQPAGIPLQLPSQSATVIQEQPQKQTPTKSILTPPGAVSPSSLNRVTTGSSSSSATPRLDIITDPVTGQSFARDLNVPGSTYKPYAGPPSAAPPTRELPPETKLPETAIPQDAFQRYQDLIDRFAAPVDFGAEALKAREAVRNVFGTPESRIAPQTEETKKLFEEAKQDALKELRGSLATRGLLSSGIFEEATKETEEGFAEKLTSALNQLRTSTQTEEQKNVFDFLKESVAARESERTRAFGLIPEILKLNRPEGKLVGSAETGYYWVTIDPQTGKQIEKTLIVPPVPKTDNVASYDAIKLMAAPLFEIDRQKNADKKVSPELYGEMRAKVPASYRDDFDRTFAPLLSEETKRGFGIASTSDQRLNELLKKSNNGTNLDALTPDELTELYSLL